MSKEVPRIRSATEKAKAVSMAKCKPLPGSCTDVFTPPSKSVATPSTSSTTETETGMSFTTCPLPNLGAANAPAGHFERAFSDT